MSRARNFLKYWLPLLLWILLIYGASGETESAQHSSRIIGPIVHWFLPTLPEAEVESIVFATRKCAHFAEYAVLALLLWRAMWKPVRHDARPWSWSVAGLVVSGVIVYATSDEIHQALVPSRQASVWDVLLDTLGGAVGLLGAAVVYQLHHRRSARRLPRG